MHDTEAAQKKFSLKKDSLLEECRAFFEEQKGKKTESAKKKKVVEKEKAKDHRESALERLREKKHAASADPKPKRQPAPDDIAQVMSAKHEKRHELQLKELDLKERVK